MEVVPLAVPRRSDPAVTVAIPFNKRNVEEWSRLDRLTGMMETAKIETDHWSARSNNAAHNYGKMVDSRQRNNKDGTIQESQRKQMEVFQTQVPGGSMQVIRTQTVTTSSKSSKWVSNDKIFSDLQLPINSLDLSSQKTKGSVGRSGSIGGRRPPSHPRSLIGQPANAQILGEETSKLTHQIHEKAKSELFKSFPDSSRLNGFNLDSDNSSVVITEISDSAEKPNGLFRRKSCSNENVAANEASDDDALKRSSKVRRSLQFQRTQPENDELEWSGGKSLKERAAEIENLLKRGSATTIGSTPPAQNEEPEKSKVVKRRDSFVSAETLKEVRDRLKKSNSDLKDDGIVTDSKVKCFVYGMEALNRPSINGTGSLEYRSSCRNSLNSRSAEWYRRRKSYGFEDVDESDKFNKFNRKSNIESSTDSGICQSSETVGVPSWSKDPFRVSPVSTIVTVGPRKDIKSYQSYGYKTDEKSVNSVYLDNPTVIRVEEQKKYGSESYSGNAWNRKSPILNQKNEEIRESLKSSLSSAKNPWISQLKGTKLVDRNWASDEQEENEDSHKTNLTKKENEAADSTQKKNKKVEFCKTEVHFAAESGKFNIVETDGKPPPNDIFRRRRRNVAAAAVHKNLSGLPETKFGDSAYEKRLLTSEKTESIREKIEAELKELSEIVIDAIPQQEENPSEFKKQNTRLYDVLEEDNENDSLKPRSILKNNGIFHVNKKESRPGGSPIPPQTQVWKSTVILRNRRYDDIRKQNDDVKVYSSDGENELQIRIRNLRKTDPKWWETGGNPVRTEVKRRSLPDDILLKQVETKDNIKTSGDEMPTLSVAERVKKVEELKSNNYSSKINFRSGEMTVVQNGSESGANEEKKRIWPQKVIDTKDRPTISCDNKTSSNPSVMRFPANKDENSDSQKYQTTRILINFQSSSQGDTSSTTTTTTTTTTEKLKTNNINKTQARYGSWCPGMKKDLNRYFNDLKSTTLVKETINSEERKEDMPKPSKTVHEIIDQFDSLSKKSLRERRRKTMPINYKAPKEYTQADLEEELKNFTENLDKDFRDIYEEEIGSVRKRAECKNEKLIKPVILKNSPGTRSPVKSSSDISSQKTSSKLNYDSDDSDLLADEEVRSYMSTGLVGTDSEVEDTRGSGKSFEDSLLQYQNIDKKKEIKNNVRAVKVSSFEKPEQKIASIALKYENDPIFARSNKKQSLTSKPPITNGLKEESDRWEKTSNSSNNSNRRERNSYLNVMSLSEIYSKYFQSSNSSLDQIPEYKIERSRRVSDSRREYTRTANTTKEESQVKPVEQKKMTKTKEITKTKEEKDNDKIKHGELLTPMTRSRSLAERRRLPVERKKPKDKAETAVLDELTRAADQILLAVNDYDDDSHLASSEDDDKTRRVIRKSKMANLSTISEGKRVTKTETRRTCAVSSTRRVGGGGGGGGTQSSASSLESLKEATRAPRTCPRLKQAENPKPLSSRATRLLQRATTRQASMPQPSSSEDLPSYIELAKKRSLRRQRSSTSVKSTEGNTETKTSSSRLKPRSKTTETTAASRTRDKKTDRAKESTTLTKSAKTSSRTSRTTATERTKTSGRRIGTEKLGERGSRRCCSSKASGMSFLAIDNFDHTQRRAYKKKPSSSSTCKSRIGNAYRAAKKKTFRKMETMTSCSDCLR